MKSRTAFATITTVALAAAVAFGQPYAIDWHTIDGGGHMVSSGGGFELGGTIGQPDAGSFAAPMSGGGFELVGGFWPVTLVCYCPGDLNGDGLLDGRDVQKFVDCLIAVPGNCQCADVNLADGVNLDDVDAFVADLLAAAACS
jgi:hypothetical protein